MKANYELKRIGIGLKTPILLLLLFLAAVFQLKAQVPDLISDPASGHYCPGASPGVKIQILGGGAVIYTLWKDNVNTTVTVMGTGSTVSPVQFAGDWTYGTYTLNGPYGAPFTEYLTVYADVPPTDPEHGTATPNTINCGGSAELSTEGGSGTTFKWYTGSCGGTEIFSSTTTSTLTVTPTETTTYYGRWENVTCFSNCVTLTVTVNPPEALIITNNPIADPSNPVCVGSSVKLTSTSSNDAIVEWYDYTWGTCSGTVTTSTGEYTVTALATSPNHYYARLAPANGCPAGVCTEVSIYTRQVPTAPTATASPTTICSGSITELSASGGTPYGGTLQWYSDEGGTVNIGSGSPITVSPTTSGTHSSTVTYYVRYENGCNGAMASVTVTVLPIPIDLGSATASVNPICEGYTTYLDVTGYQATDEAYIQWYTGSCGGTELAIGRNIPVSPTETTTYWARTDNGVCTSPNCVSVTVTVNPKPGTPSVSGATTICNSGSTMLTAEGGPYEGSTIKWYANGVEVPALSGQMTPTVAPTVTTGYYARFVNTACPLEGEPSNVVTITVYYRPTTPTIVPSASTICYGSEVSLNVTGGGSPNPDQPLTLNWYRGFSPCAGTYTPATTVIPFVDMPSYTQTYYAQYYSEQCGVSGCATQVICVDYPANAPTGATATPAIVCEGTISQLTATGTPGVYVNPCPGCDPQTIQATMTWYKNGCGTENGGTLVSTGTTISVSPTTTTTYFARYENTCTPSACVSATVTVNKVSNPTSITEPATICKGNGTTISVGFDDEDFPSTTHNGTIAWYKSELVPGEGCGFGEKLSSTATSITVSPTVTTYYYVRTENINGGVNCYSTCTSTVVTVLNPLTPSVTATKYRVCQSDNSVTLTATVPSGATGIVHWYAGSCGEGTTPGVATGTTYIVAVPYPGQTYYAKMIDGDCYSSGCASATITVDSPNTISAISATVNPVCQGSSTTLSTVTGGSAGSLYWYSGSQPCGGTLLQTGGNLTVTPVITSVYFARVEGGACPNSDCVSKTITLSPVPTTPVITTPNTTICVGSSITINAEPGPVGTTINWYTYCPGGTETPTALYTGNSYTVTPTIGVNVYYARMESPNCTSSDCASVTITASPQPALPTGVTATPSNICFGNTTQLSASGPVGTTIAWYYTCGSGDPFATGSPITVTPTTTGPNKYYVRTESTGCTASMCESVTVTVTPMPVDPVSIDATATTICKDNPVTMVAHSRPAVSDSTGYTANWYTGSSGCGNTLIATVPIGKAWGALTVAPTITTIYYVKWQSPTCGASNCAEITINVIAKPVAPTSATATPGTICLGESSALSVTNGSGATLKWYTNAACTTPATGTVSGTNFIVTPPTKNTYVYYARWETEPWCSASAAVSATVVVHAKDPVPTITTTPAPTVCVNNVESVHLNATKAAGSTGTLHWYKGSCNGPEVGTGGTLDLTAAICTRTTTFFVSSVNDCGSSECAQITVTVDQIPDPPATVGGPGTMCSGAVVHLTASAAPAGTVTKWYATDCGVGYFNSGADVTVSPTNLGHSNITKYYYARNENTCVSSCKTVTIVVNPLNTAPETISASQNPICQGQGTTLTATGGSGVTLKWYTGSGPCGGTFLSSSNPLTVTPVLTSRYFARYEGGECPVSPDCESILITVNDVPQTPTSISDPVTICSGSTVTLTTTYTAGNGVSIEWSKNCGLPVIGTNTTLVDAPTVTTTYYARTVATSCTPSACLSVTVTVNKAGTMATVSENTAICEGSETTLSASVSGGVNNTITWYKDACGGSRVHTGATYTVSPATTTTYYVRSEAGSCDPSSCLSVTVTVNRLPVAPSAVLATANPVCNGSPTTLSVTPDGYGTTLYWYNGSTPCLPPFVATGTTLTVYPTITTIYWASWGTETCGASPCVPITINVSDVPQIPNVYPIEPVTICNGNSTTLTGSFVPGVGVSLKWYDVNPVTNPGAIPVATGGTLTIAPTVTTTYYARTESAGCTPSACKTKTVTVSDVPTTPTSISGPVTICTGTSTTLNATYNPGAGISLNWYKDECGLGTSVGSGPTYTVPTTLLAGTHKYYARTESANCTSSNCLQVTVTVIPAATNLTSISKSPSEAVCEGTPVTLTAEGGSFTTDAVLKWYTGGCGGTLIGTSTGTRTLTVNPPVTTTYYARFENVACVGACVSVTVNIKPKPVAPTSLVANPNPVCIGHSTTITANGIGSLGAGSILEWYSGSKKCEGPLVASGTSSITVFPQINPTQYSAHVRNECGVSTCAVVNVYIDPLPEAPTSITSDDADNIICVGSSITMTAHGGSGTVLNWYLGDCGVGNVQGTGPVLTVTPAAGTYTYFARWENNCDPSTCAQITITVYPIPTAPTITATFNQICVGSLTTLTAVSGGGTGSTIKWYKDNCGGTPIASGVTSLQVSPATTATYFARYENSACMSECASKTITVYAVPVAPTSASANPNKVCFGSTTVLTTTGGSGETLVWYKGTCGGISNKVGEGNNLTVTPTATSTYYARWENPACQSTCAMVTVQVVLSPIAPTAANVSAAEICEGTSVQLTAVGGSNGTAKWYADGCGTEGGGTFVGNGVGSNAALTVTPTVGTTVYYVRYENPPCDASECAAVTVTTYATPVAPTSITANPPVVGVGLTTQLTANGGSGVTVKWYTGSCVGTEIGTGNPLVVTVTGNTTYYAKWTNPVCSSGCASVTVTTQTLALSGVVKYNNQYNVALNGVIITLKQGSTTIAKDTTSTQIVGGIPTPGYYNFTGLLPGAYTLDATYGGTWGGVNATDALLIEQHDATLITLQYLYLTAGDVNADTYVNSIDALWVKMRTVAMVNYFLAGDWVFGTTTSGSLPAINLTTTQTFNFVGLCTGDVNGSYIPSGTKEASFISFMDDGIRYVKPGETFSYDVVADKSAEVGAMTLFMNYDENLVEVEKVSSALGEVQSKIDGNNIGVAWSSVNPANVDATTPVLTLTMKAKGTIEEPKQVFTVNGGSEFANGKAIRLDNLNLKMAKLATATHSFSLNNYPNPFNNSTNIVYTLPEKAHVTLVITNLYGEVLRTVVNGDVSAGAHQVTVNASDLNLSTGVYLYKIEVNGETDNFSQVNKMIFTR